MFHYVTSVTDILTLPKDSNFEQSAPGGYLQMDIRLMDFVGVM